MDHKEENRKHMSVSDAMTGMDMIRQTALHLGVPETEVRRDMQAALDEAWATDDPAVMALQMQLFPAGKPCLEDFILTLARLTLKQNVTH